jgi:hypothetical protein
MRTRTRHSTARPIDDREIVTSGVAVPEAAEKLLGLLNRYSWHERKEITEQQ